MPAARATAPTKVMKSPDNGSTTSTASLNGKRRGTVADQDAPARAPTPASTPPRPTRLVNTPERRARHACEAREKHGTPAHARAAAPATSRRPDSIKLIDRSTLSLIHISE